MFDILLVGSGILWTVTYLLIIRRGFLDHTYGMPLVALCANLSWEFIFSFVFPHGPVQRPVNVVWFSLDLITSSCALDHASSRGSRRGSSTAWWPSRS
jgi:hypothetical protein